MEQVEMVSLAAYESQGSRFIRIIRWLIMGWVISMVAWGLAFVICTSYAEEVVTETTEASQDADNYGSNAFTYGDYYDGYANGQDNDDNQNGEEGTGIPNAE